jgi:pimeloyl-ACP methyl ester carboxylesterase
VVVVVVAVGLAGALGAAPAAADERGAEPAAGVEWGACPADVAENAPQLECGLVPVPLDYADREGTQIEVMISRLAGPDPEGRRGVLLLNPGGPGGSGLTMPADLTALGVPDSVTDGYDLIGMDTRGVGHSTPVSCGFTADQDYYGNIPPYAADDAAFTAQAERAEAVADQCAANDTDGLLRHISTANIARDLDRVRAALGEEKASYFGLSYGSALGAAYASMFPERTDRVILDSNVGDTHLGHDGMRRFALGAEETFPDFAEWVAARHGSYGLGRTAKEVRATYFTLAERLDAEPFEGVDGAVFRLASFAGLYSESQYAFTARLWQSVHESDAAAVRRHLEEGEPFGLPAVGPAAAPAEAVPSPYDNFWSAFLAVTCNDSDWPEDVDAYRSAIADDRERYPLYGAAAANITPCAFWPHEPAEPPVEVDDDGPRNVLIVQNLRDPATPHRGGELLREAFRDRSRLVSVDASGHGAYVYGDNACAWNTATAFLVDGRLPKRDTSCAASPASALGLDGETERSRAEALDRLPSTI